MSTDASHAGAQAAPLATRDVQLQMSKMHQSSTMIGQSKSRMRSKLAVDSRMIEALAPTPEQELGEDPDRVANPLEFYTMMIFGIFITGSFAITIPTASNYVSIVGADPNLSGIVIGMLPFFTAIGAYPIMYLINAVGIKNALLFSLVLNVFGNILYACAGLANSFSMIVIGRILLGLGLLPSTLGAYITRTFGVNTRSKAALIMGMFTGFGFAMGPLTAYLLGFLAEYTDSRTGGVLTAETLPGYVSAIFNVVYFLMVFFIVVEPPLPPPPKAADAKNASKEEPYLGSSIVNCIMSFVPAVIVAAWEVNATDLVKTNWGFSSQEAALYLAGVNAGLGVFTILIAYVLSPMLTDRVGMMAFMFLTTGFSLMIIPWFGATATGTAVFAVYTIGAVFIDTGLQNGKQFSWANITKKPPQHMKMHAFAWVMMAYFSGRGVGAFISPFFDQEVFGWICFGGSFLCGVLAMCSAQFIGN